MTGFIRRPSILRLVAFGAGLATALAAIAPARLAIASPPAVASQPASQPSPADLLADAVWEYSIDRGANWTPKPPTQAASGILAQANFSVTDPARYAAVELNSGFASGKLTCTINGQPTSQPIAGMTYDRIQGIPADRLKPGPNTLVVEFHRSAKTRPQLLALTPQDLRIQTGPILGAAGQDFLTLTCRTNMPVAMTLRVAGRSPTGDESVVEQTSQPGLIHRFRVENFKLAPSRRWSYSLYARTPPYSLTTEPRPVRLMPGGRGPAIAASGDGRPRPLRFATLGDSKKNLKDWSSVAAAVLATQPDFVVHLGDMTENGAQEWLWDGYFFKPDPVRELFATTPLYTIMGNHEENPPLFFDLFYPPGGEARSKIWSQQIGGVLLVGIDGSGDWSPRKKDYQALEQTLSQSQARFIFLFTHYPAFTSSRHGGVDDEGEPSEKLTRTAHDLIYPLAAKYHVTAMVTGHEHCYERSELPGLTQVTTGTAGASRRTKAADAAKQNPYSKVFASKLNFGLFEVDADVCRMTAFAPDGQILDRAEWRAIAPR